MATFLDVGILENFSIVFVFLLIFTVVYGLLEVIGMFGKDKKGLSALVALSVGILIIISKAAVVMINFITPWFIVLFLFIFFMIFAVRMFGVSETDTINIIKDSRVYPYLIVFGFLILIAGFSSAFGQSLLEQGTGVEGDGDTDVILPENIEGGSTKTTSFGSNVLNTLVHPKVLGFIALMLIALFTLIFLTKLT